MTPADPLPSGGAGREALPDLLRSASILVVLAIHLASSGLLLAPTGLLGGAWDAFARNGSYGVTVFFVLSGYLVSRMALARDGSLFTIRIARFYQLRLARIWPLLLGVIALGALALWWVPAGPCRDFCFQTPGAPFDGWFWGSLFVGAFNWLRIARETHAFGFGLHWDVMWSLAIEEQFYLFFPLACRLAGTPRRLFAGLCLLLLLGPLSRLAALAFAPHSLLWVLTNSFAAFDMLAAGVLLAWQAPRWDPWLARNKAWSAGLALGGLALLLGAYLTMPLAVEANRLWGPSLIGLGTWLLLLGGRHWLKRETRLTRWLSWPGRLSYGLYLLHAGVLALCWPLLQGRAAWPAYLAFTLLTLGAAELSMRYWEAPLARRIRQASWPRALRPAGGPESGALGS